MGNASRTRDGAPGDDDRASERLTWVSKTNVTDFLRCPYAFWLYDSKQISHAESLTPFLEQLISAGVAFEDRVVAAAKPVDIPAGSEAEYLRGEHTVVTAGRMFRNEDLRLRGSPDMIMSASGAVEPVEIKSHRRVLQSDLVELAFYWRLLKPLRSRQAEPVGWVFLRAPDGSIVEVRVLIGKDIFAEVDGLIGAVRAARRDGVEPRYCRCPVCSGVRRDHVRRRVTETQDVSAVWGVGKRYAPIMRAFGAGTWGELIASDPDAITECLWEQGVANASTRVVRRWQAHATALSSREPAWVTGPATFPVPTNYIAFDLEYNAEAHDVWLIGARVVHEAGDVRVLLLDR